MKAISNAVASSHDEVVDKSRSGPRILILNPMALLDCVLERMRCCRRVALGSDISVGVLPLLPLSSKQNAVPLNLGLYASVGLC